MNLKFRSKCEMFEGSLVLRKTMLFYVFTMVMVVSICPAYLVFRSYLDKSRDVYLHMFSSLDRYVRKHV